MMTTTGRARVREDWKQHVTPAPLTQGSSSEGQGSLTDEENEINIYVLLPIKLNSTGKGLYVLNV